jgi:hypothetical protein
MTDPTSPTPLLFRETKWWIWFTVLDGLELDLCNFESTWVVHASTELAHGFFACVDTLAISLE